MNKRILKINASALKHAFCLRHTYLDIVEGLIVPGTSNNIVFGSAFHKFAEAYSRTRKLESSVLKAYRVFRSAADVKVKKNYEYLNLSYLQACCIAWAEKYDSDSFQVLNSRSGKPMVEVNFAIPFASYDDMDVLLCGTIDKIGKFQNGCYAVGDYKTTAAWDYDGYFAQYKLDVQMICYRYAIRYHARAYPESIFAEIESKGQVGAFLDGIFTSKKDPFPTIQRSPVMFISDLQLAEFELQVRELLDRLYYAINVTKMPPREGMIKGCCSMKFGESSSPIGCKYFGACSSPDDVSCRMILNNNYTRKVYDPLTFGGNNQTLTP